MKLFLQLSKRPPLSGGASNVASCAGTSTLASRRAVRRRVFGVPAAVSGFSQWICPSRGHLHGHRANLHLNRESAGALSARSFLRVHPPSRLPRCSGHLQGRPHLPPPSMSCSPHELRLKQMGNLLGSRRPGDGEQTLIQPPQGPDAAVTPGFLYVLAFFSALGGFLFGYDTGVVSGAMLPLKREMHLDSLWQELLVSSTVGAAAVSSLGGGFLNGWLGRRVCILIASFIFSVGGVVLGLAPSREVLLVGRVTVGLGIGEFASTQGLFAQQDGPREPREPREPRSV